MTTPFRQHTFSDLCVAGKYSRNRIRCAEAQLALRMVELAVMCAAVPKLGRLLALVAMAVCISTLHRYDPPPPILRRGSLRRLHPRDAELCRIARQEYQSLAFLRREAPTLLLSWLFLGAVASLG